MTTALAATVATIRAAERVSPDLAARLALPLFMRVGAPLPVRPADRAVHEGARRGILHVRGRDVVAYEWGSGPDTVLLMHGWRGRASQFAPIIRELRAEGFRLVAVEAPANGDSAGRRTDMRDYLAAIEALHSRHGRFHDIVGHSFGSLAALTAVRAGVATGGVVAVAGMADARYLVDSFASRLGVGGATADALAERFAGRIFPGEHDVWPRFDAVRAPLPADVPLLVVHDRGDREVAVGEGVRLHDAHGDRSRIVLTNGSGHSRVLGADAALDAITAFVTAGPAGVDAAGLGRVEAASARQP
jgi:pimeloyl-ACP methyl ester carboxylesterase